MEEKKVFSWIREDHDQTPYGTKLAKKFAKELKKRKKMIYDHRDYCGKGFIYEENKYSYVTVNDGFPMDKDKTFDTEHEFVTWLAAQSDESLCGKDESVDWMQDNQRITKERLEEFC